MSGSVEVVLWLHEYELKALDKHLASNGTDVEKRMQEMLADLYSECVPFEERQAIQERINAEHAEAVADQMANTTWAAYHITGHGEDLYFKTSKADTLLTAAKRLRTYLTAEDNPQPATLAAVLKDRTEITQAEYDQLLDQRLQNTSLLCIPKAEHLYRSEMGKTAGQTRRKGTHTKLRGYGADRIQAAFYERDFFPGRHERVRKSVEFLCASHI